MAILKANFYSRCLMRPVDVNIILPIDNSTSISSDNDASSQARYRTLYLLHGIMGNHNDWLYNTDILNLAIKHNVAVVMPSGGNEFFVNHPTRQQNYSDFVGLELPAMMEHMFPLLNNASSRFIGGLSMGGYGALINGIRLSERFSHIFGLSSALFLDDVYHLRVPKFLPKSHTPMSKTEVEAYYTGIFGNLNNLKNSEKDYYYLTTQLIDNNLTRPNIMLACGQEDIFSHANRAFAKHLDNLNFELTYIDNKGGHNWNYWSDMIGLAIDWLPS